MKKYFLLSLLVFPLVLFECKAENPANTTVKSNTSARITHLNDESFKKMIFNYEVNKTWKYEGKKPAIIDFYADWCAPCRQLSPIVEQIAEEYSGKIDIFKVDTEKEKTLAGNLGITGLPTLLFIPVEGKPQVSMGLLPKENLVKAINEILMVK